MEIRRLIEERRSISQQEKQRLKYLSKQIKKKKHQGQEKSKKTRRDSTNTRTLQRDQEHSRNQICIKKSTHHQDKERERRSHFIKEGKLPMSLVNSTKNLTMTKNTKKLNWNTKRMRLKAASMSKAKIRVRWKEFQRSRLKIYRLQSTDSKKGKSADSNGIIAEDIKACDEETKEMVRQIFNEILKQNECTPEAWRKVRIKVIHKKKWRWRCRKLPPDLVSACAVQTVYDNTVQQIKPKTWPNPSGRSGGFVKLLPNYRLSSDVQDDWSEMPRVGNQKWPATIVFMKAFDSITHKSIWDALKSCGIEHWIHPPPEKTVQRPESHSTDRRRNWHVRDQYRNQTGWPSVKLALQHCSADSLGRRHFTLAKEEDWVSAWETTIMTVSQTWELLNLLLRGNGFLKHVMWLQAQHRKSGTQNTSRKHENPQQPKLEHQDRNWDWTYQRRDLNKRRKYKNIWARWLLSSSRRRPKSEIASGLRG